MPIDYRPEPRNTAARKLERNARATRYDGDITKEEFANKRKELKDLGVLVRTAEYSNKGRWGYSVGKYLYIKMPEGQSFPKGVY